MESWNSKLGRENAQLYVNSTHAVTSIPPPTVRAPDIAISLNFQAFVIEAISNWPFRSQKVLIGRQGVRKYRFRYY
jgi:hypothetical protein